MRMERRLLIFVLAASLAACAAGPKAQSDGVLIFGASRATGLETAKVLTAGGEKVTAFVRASSDRSGLEPLKVSYAVGDALNAQDVRAAFAGKKFSSVVSTLGGKQGEPMPDFEGTKNLVDAAKAAGVKRVVIVTVLGPGDSMAVVPDQQRKALGRIIAVKEDAENYLIQSGLQYTILRPGQLTNLAANGKLQLTEKAVSAKPITRADLAQKVVDCLNEPKTIGKILYPSSTE